MIFIIQFVIIILSRHKCIERTNSMNNYIKQMLNNGYDDFIKNIIDGMYDWVRVIDTDDNVVYVNKAMSGFLMENPIGQKCYAAIGKNSPCVNCTSRHAVFEGITQHKEEIIQGRIYSVMSSPIKGSDGKIFAVVEVLRDITEMKKLQREIMEQNKKLQSELYMAKKLQCSLLPRNIPKESLNFAYIYKPCETLGGDFLDIYRIDEDNIGLYIADVSGHGVLASMLTVFLRSTINKKFLSPAKALNELFEEFNNIYPDQDLYITIFYAIINFKNKTLTYSNAGHNAPPILISHSTSSFEVLRCPGIPISNWMEEPIYSDRTVSLSKNHRIFLYTDGVVELKNKDSEQFGEERLLNILLKEKSSPSETLNTIVTEASNFAQLERVEDVLDDITMALLEIL